MLPSNCGKKDRGREIMTTKLVRTAYWASAAIAPAFEPSLCRLRSPLPGKRDFRGGEKCANTSPEPRISGLRDQRSYNKPANSGPFSTTTENFLNRRNAWWWLQA